MVRRSQIPISNLSKHDLQIQLMQTYKGLILWHPSVMDDYELTPKQTLNLQREYVAAVREFVKPSNKRKLEAIAADDAELEFANYFTDLYVPTNFCMIFMVYSSDDVKISKGYSRAYSVMGHEFLEINDACNRWNLSVLKVAKCVKEIALPYIHQGRSADVKYTFEAGVSDLAIELRAHQLSKLTVKSPEKTITDYFGQIGLKI